MAFQHKLKKLREEKGLSMEELVNELHKHYGLSVNKSTISRWENGAEPKGKDLHYIAHYFKVSPSELIDLDLIKIPEDQMISVSLPTYNLPLYGSIFAGALATVEGVTVDDVEFIALPKQMLGKYKNCPKLFGMIVNGDSMNKIIQHGSLVVAKPLGLDQYKDGDIVIFSYNNEFSLKRYAPNDLDGYVLFKSESTDNSFKDIPIPIDAVNDLKIYGKIIYYGTTL
ncbi:LexA family protein [Lysinibacillus sphaericus]|uniref:LexA family protein n=1 Tax=Lysinibacillus sphaericus TaxID=1421 RepID=UPI003D7FDA9A